MDPFFTEPDADRQPMELIRFENISVEPYPDRKKVKLLIEVTPFLEKPNIEIGLFNQDGILIASMSLVEIIEYKFELTLHIKNVSLHGENLIQANIYYDDLSQYEIKENNEEETKKPAGNKIVNKMQKRFTIQEIED